MIKPIARYFSVIHFYFSIDTKTYNDPGPDQQGKPQPIIMKTSTFTRSEKEPKSCFRDANYWDHPQGKKKLCLINRYDYLHELGAPVYPCTLDVGPKYDQGEYTLDERFVPAGCRPDWKNGTLGKFSVKELGVQYSVFFSP